MSLQTHIARRLQHRLPPNPQSKKVTDFVDLRTSVVIAEDNNSLRDLLVYLLTAKGYTVRCADDGESGWESMSSAPFDLLITDHDMPRLTGLDLLRRMRASSLTHPVILMSANLPRQTAEMENLLTPGAVLAKPFSISALAPMIENLLNYTHSSPRMPRKLHPEPDKITTLSGSF